jgi:hypothetical protein
VLSQHGGIVPAARRHSLLALTLTSEFYATRMSLCVRTHHFSFAIFVEDVLVRYYCKQLDASRNETSPASLMACTDACPVIAIKVLIK